VRADRASGDAPAAAGAHLDPLVAGTTAHVDDVSAAATSLWAAVDTDDVKAFVAACGEWKDGKVVDGDAKGLESMLMEFHQKYGLRTRHFGAAKPVEGSDGEVEVAVLIGDREVLLLCGMRLDANRKWRLVRISDGDPTSIEDETPVEKPAEPAMGEAPAAPTPPKKDESPPR
jgi:hypothetical protein